MLENLTDLVKQYAGDAIGNNSAIPTNKKDEAITDAASSIISGFKTAIANGKLDVVADFFKGKENAVNSPIEKDIEAGYANNLVQKFGLDKGKAGQIAAMLIPLVLNKLVGKANDPGDKGFDVKNIIASLTGGGIGDMLGKLGSNDNKNDDGGAFGKLKGMFN